MDIGISSCGKQLDAKLFAGMAEEGISRLELSLGSNAQCDIELAPVSALAREYGITLWSYHLPFAPFNELNPAALNEEIRQNTLRRFRGLIDAGARAGIGVFVMHLSGEPISDAERAQAMAQARRTLEELAPWANERGATLAIENLPRSCLGNCSGDMLQALETDGRLMACFDTNHLLKEDIFDFIRAVGKRFITTHVSDFDFVNERHWLPGEGDINWQALISALEEAGYTGPWLYELGFEAPNTLLRPRELTLRDFADNARALFSGQTPAPVGARKPGLGMWG